MARDVRMIIGNKETQLHLVYLSSKTEVLEAYTDLMGNEWTRIQ